MPMNTRPTSKRLETHHKQQDENNANVNPSSLASSMPMPASIRLTAKTVATGSTTEATPKPQRPLTAYHIFFQIEREYIIQTTAGPTNASENSNQEKKLLRNVPSRYANTKLRPDWYAGPGKRQKRKHRKSHGKIGFHELSTLISTRWAALEKTHPDVKKFVHEIAARELDEYKLEMERYKLAENITSDPTPAPTAAKKATTKKRKYVTKKQKAASSTATTAKISPPSSSDVAYDMHFATSICTDDEEEDEVDYSISSVTCNGHHIPSPPSESDFSKTKLVDSDEAFLDPLFQLSHVEQPTMSPSPRKKQRCVSPPAFLPNMDCSNDYFKLSSQLWTF